jgi:hypothetical protein
MLDQAIRFGAIISQPKFKSGGRLLEVGSGDEGISVFIDDPVIGADIAFRDVSNLAIKAIKASALKLPFGDAAFERVVCSDMLEHLAESDRAAAISELVRVTGGVLFLACPCGGPARWADNLLYGIYRILPVRTPDWLKEHIQRRIPDTKSIREAIGETGARYHEVKGESIFTHFIVSFLISSRILNNIWRNWYYKKPGKAKAAAVLGRWPWFFPYRRLWVIQKQ